MEEYKVSDFLTVREGRDGEATLDCLMPNEDLMDDEPNQIQRRKDMESRSAVITRSGLEHLLSAFESKKEFDWNSEDGKLTIHATPRNLNLVFPLKEYPFSRNRTVSGREAGALADALAKIGRGNIAKQ